MSNKALKYKISPTTVRKANQALIKNGISESTRNSYNGDIVVKYAVKGAGVKVRSFSNNDIKDAYQKALHSYAEKV